MWVHLRSRRTAAGNRASCTRLRSPVGKRLNGGVLPQVSAASSTRLLDELFACRLEHLAWRLSFVSGQLRDGGVDVLREAMRDRRVGCADFVAPGNTPVA